MAGLPVAFEEVGERQPCAAHDLDLLAPDLEQFLVGDGVAVDLRVGLGHALLPLAELPQVVVDEAGAVLALVALQEGQSVLEAELLQFGLSLLVVLDVADVSQFGVDGCCAA